MAGFFKRRESGGAVAVASQPKRRHRFRIKGTTIFIIAMLAYPLIQFAIMWFGVNINSIFLTFKDNYDMWRPLDELFYNYETVFEEMATNSTWQSIYAASAAYIVLNCFVTLPVSMLFAYFIFKKIYAAGVFKAIFYLPSVLPIVALTTVYTLAFQQSSDATGFMGSFFGALGIDTSTWFFAGDAPKWMVWVFCFWTGIGYDVMLMSAAMSRIPRELLESAKMDGITPFKEFFYVVVPLSWPTVTTLFIFAMLGFFGTYLQPMLLTQGQYGTNTIGLQIFYEADVPMKVHAATVGLVWTLIGAPVILGVRSLLNHFFKEVNF